MPGSDASGSNTEKNRGFPCGAKNVGAAQSKAIEARAGFCGKVAVGDNPLGKNAAQRFFNAHPFNSKRGDESGS
jgi:hypothetical protein